jgi:hypothetical protein
VRDLRIDDQLGSPTVRCFACGGEAPRFMSVRDVSNRKVTMKWRDSFLWALVFVVLADTAHSQNLPSDSEMLRAGRNWLRAYFEYHHTWQDSSDVLPEVVELRRIAPSDTVIGAALLVRPGGMLLVPRTRNLPPIYAYSTTDGWSLIDPDPCHHLLRQLEASYARALRQGDDDEAQRQWRTLLEEKTDGDPPVMTISAGPLMSDIAWHQGIPYNGACPAFPVPLCPPGLENHRCPVGCMASATARILRYHAYPDRGEGQHAYQWNGISEGACQVDPALLEFDYEYDIDWDHLPKSCVNCSPEDSTALATFCYGVAVGLDMPFGRTSSGPASIPDQIFSDHYGYPGTVRGRCYGEGADLGASMLVIRDELNARRPVWTYINQMAHAVCIDGWGYSDDKPWLHINDDGGGAYWTALSNFAWLEGFVYGINSPIAMDSVLVQAQGGDFANIQAAVDAVPAGCQIYLADGIYTGAGNRDVDFHGKSVTVRSLSGDPDACVIDCGGSAQDPHRGFYLHSGERGDAVVRDLTITGGYIDHPYGGGAILCGEPGPSSTPPL